MRNKVACGVGLAAQLGLRELLLQFLVGLEDLLSDGLVRVHDFLLFMLVEQATLVLDSGQVTTELEARLELRGLGSHLGLHR